MKKRQIAAWSLALVIAAVSVVSVSAEEIVQPDSILEEAEEEMTIETAGSQDTETENTAGSGNEWIKEAETAGDQQAEDGSWEFPYAAEEVLEAGPEEYLAADGNPSVSYRTHVQTYGWRRSGSN